MLPVPLPLLQRRKLLGLQLLQCSARLRLAPPSPRQLLGQASSARNHPRRLRRPLPGSSAVVANLQRQVSPAPQHLLAEAACLARSPPPHQLPRVRRQLRPPLPRPVVYSEMPPRRPLLLPQLRLLLLLEGYSANPLLLQEPLRPQGRQHPPRPSRRDRFLAVPRRRQRHNPQPRPQPVRLPPPRGRHQRRLRRLPQPREVVYSAASPLGMRLPLRLPRIRAVRLRRLAVLAHSVRQPLARRPDYPR